VGAQDCESQESDRNDIARAAPSSVPLRSGKETEISISLSLSTCDTFSWASLQILGDFARCRLSTISSVFMSTTAAPRAPEARILVSPFSVLPVCHLGSVPLTAVGHSPKEGPQHMARARTQATGQFGENVVFCFFHVHTDDHKY